MRAMRKWNRSGLAGLVIGLFGAATALAEPIAWTAPAGGSWHTPGNWDLNRVPLNTDAVTIGLDGTYTVTISSGANAQSLTLGGTSGTQTLVINSTSLNIATHATVLANGEVELNRATDAVFFDFPAVNGTLTNQGIVRAIGVAGNIHLQGNLNNQGLFTVQGPTIQLGFNGRNHIVTNSGTINVATGGFTSHYGGGIYYSGLSLIHSGTITIAAGAHFRQAYGTLTMNGGSFGGAGQLFLFNSTANLATDFHTGDCGSMAVSSSTFNGPGQVINDRVGGIAVDGIAFNTLVDNRTVLSTQAVTFNAGLLNPAGATLRVLTDNLQLIITSIAGGFTNNGTVKLVSFEAALRVTGGPLVNNGLIEARREGSPQGTRIIEASIVNTGTITNVDVSQLVVGGPGSTSSINNSGTINVAGGNLATSTSSTITVTNTGTFAVGNGRTYTQTGGTLNLNGGTFGGAGANLNLTSVILNHAADFHTADWSSLSISSCTFNGPGQFINDRPGGFDPSGVTFNTVVNNQTTLSTNSALFAGGFLNGVGSTLRLTGPSAYFRSGFTNAGVIELTASGTQFWILSAANVIGTLVNTGQINIGTPGGSAGNRLMACILDNQGTVTVHDGADLKLGYNATNSGTINVTNGNLSSNGNSNITFTNTGTVAFAPGRSYSQTNGTLNLNAGTFGGVGASMTLTSLTLNLATNFHTADWSSLSLSGCTVNGPGQFINDRPGGFNPSGVTFNTLVDNRSTLSTYIGAFNAGLLNPAGSLLRILGDNNETVTTIAGGFTNNGTVHLISRGAALSVTGGPLVNNGLIEARREGSPQGTRALYFSVLNNNGTITNLDVSDLRLGGGNATLAVNNSGTFNVIGGDLSNWDGGNAANTLTFTNTGTVAFAPGRTYRQRGGSLNLNAGTFGGAGANLHVSIASISHTADFHTADWASCPGYQTIYNGPGKFVNDHPTGYIGDCPSGGPTTFNTLVQNKTHFTSRACFFTSGFQNPLGATLRVEINADGSRYQTHLISGFTNHGVIEIVSPNARLATLGLAPNYTMHTLTNSPTGQIHIRRLGTAPGHRFLVCNIANYGTLTVHDADLQVGEGNYFMLINNYGTLNLNGGNLVFPNAPNNKAWFNNYGVLNIGAGRTINQPPGGVYPPLLFINKPGAILSGSGTIFGGEGGPTVDNKIEINGIVRPGGENAVGTLTLAGNVSVPVAPLGNPSDIWAIVELDLGAAGAQANDHVTGLNGLDGPEHGGRYVSVNVIGSNLPPPGDGISLAGWPFVASNLPVFDGGICVGCLGGGPGTACSAATVLGACPGPTITQQPQSQSPCAGDTVSLSVVATGADPLTYQWQRITTSVVNLANGPTGNGSTISGADGPTLTISSLAVSDLGSYAVVVSDANGSRISTLATLIGGCVINVTAATPQPFLDSLITPAATIVMQNVPDRPTLILPALTGLGGAMHVIGNGGLTNLQAALLATIGGGLDIRNNPLLTDVTLPALTTVTGDLDVSGNTGATAIDFPQLGGVGGEVTIHNNPLTTTIDFPQLGSVGGEVAIHNNPLTTTIAFPQLGGVGGEVTIHNNPLTTTIGFPQLGGVGGEVAIHNNLLTTTIDFPQLGSVGGDVTVFNNPAATVVGLGSLQTVVGSVSIRDNLALAAVSMPLLTDVDGGVDVSGNTSATTVTLGGLATVGGDVTVTGNTSATTVTMGGLTTTGGDMTVSGNTSATTVTLGGLETVSGDVTVSGNSSATTVTLGGLTNAGGNVTVSGNTSTTTVVLGGLVSTGGDVTITDNPAATDIALDSLTDVGGDLTLETQVQADVDLSAVEVVGDIDVASTGATSVEVQTPGGTTSVEMCNDAACMDADLPDDAAPAGTPFAVLRVDPQTLGRVPGLDETGQPAGVDPVAAYAFTLGAPLQGAASLVFELTLASLSPAEQAAVLDAYSDGRLTLTVQGDNPGDAPQARAQCGPSDPLVADGCVKVGAFDALGFQLPPGVTAGAVMIRIAALVSHFSTYAVSIVTGRGDMNCDGEIDLADVEPFVQALTDPAGYTAAHGSCPALGADMNQDGAANGVDIAPFTAAVLPAP